CHRGTLRHGAEDDGGPHARDRLHRIIETEINPVQSVTRVRTTIVLSAVAERPPMAGHDLDRSAE
ncbi:MAG: hypothetical protein AAFY66_20120, partial [Pseudomonadota bacterium]